MDVDLLRRASERWPHVAHSEESLAKVSAVAHSLDLYLARCAAQRQQWALTAMESEVFQPVQARLSARFDKLRAEEAMQQLRVQLLVDEPGLKGFGGAGTLIGWLTVVATRRILKDITFDVSLDEALMVSDQLDVVMHLRSSSLLKRALAAAFASLPRRARLLLRLHTLDGLSAEKIALVFHVHRETASQRLLEARTALREKTLERVQLETGEVGTDLESLTRTMMQNTDLSLGRLLAEDAQR